MTATAKDAIIALLKMDRDKCSNGAWADELSRHFGLDHRAVRREAYPPKPTENNPRLGYEGCEGQP